MKNPQFFTHNIEELPEFDNHKLVMFVSDKESGLRGFIAVHRGNSKMRSFGATRYWDYDDEGVAMRDALKLSKTMSYKAALAGLPYGGAKAVLIKNGNKDKKVLLKTFAKKVNYLNGNFITGADVGLDREDVISMKRVSPYMVGIYHDPVRFTALGLLYSIQVCLKEIYGKADISGRTFAIQGCGKVGNYLTKLLYKEARQIYVADINKTAVQKLIDQYPNVKAVDPLEIHREVADVYSPCALSNCLNSQTIPELQCSAVVGSANGQLENDSCDEILYKRNILYAPDYVVNSGGFISVVDEFENKIQNIRRVEEKVKNISVTMTKILRESKKLNKPTHYISSKIAETIFAKI